MRYISISLAFSGLLCLSLITNAQAQPIWETKLIANDGDEGDAFGSAVSLYGSRALIGANGAAYVYELLDGIWREYQNFGLIRFLSLKN